MKKAALIEKYKKGHLSPAEEHELEVMVANGDVSMAELGLDKLHDMVMSADVPATSESLNDGFYSMLAAEKTKAARKVSWESLTMIWSRPFFRYAYSALLIFIGIMIGNQFLKNDDYNNQVEHLSKEITSMKEMLMLQLLEQESTTDRLRAVSLTDEMPEVGDKVTAALLKTLNHDENTNVRLAALEALLPFSNQPKVREGLIESIGRQTSPMVQVALAEVMVALQEKRSVDKLEKLIDSDSTPAEVKETIKENLKVLI